MSEGSSAMESVDASAPATREGARDCSQTPRGRRVPLNSRRLTAVHLRQVGRALDLPTSGSADEVRQLIEGKLADRDAQNVQVMVDETLRMQTMIWLVDSEGPFLQTDPSYRDSPGSSERDQECRKLREQNGELHERLADLQSQSEEQGRMVAQLETELESLRGVSSDELAAEVERVKAELVEEREKRRQLWQTTCQQVAEQDRLLSTKEDELLALRTQLASLSPRTVLPRVEEEDSSERARSPSEARAPPPLIPPRSVAHESRTRRGKAPPVEPFTGENAEVQFEDWLPTLERAAAWNGWSEEDLLLQLAGHLRGRAFQEWNLLQSGDKATFPQAKEALQLRLDPGSKVLAAQDFRHTIQGSDEKVTDFVRRLERTFQVAYGRDGLPATTRDALLHGQLHEGLRYEIMQGPSVSGASSYKELCMSAKNEERRLAELRKRQQYQRVPASVAPARLARPEKSQSTDTPLPKPAWSTAAGQRTCYVCNKPGHLARDCRSKRSESRGQFVQQPKAGTKQVQSWEAESATSTSTGASPLDLLESSLDDETPESVYQVRVQDRGSKPQCIKIQLQGVPVYGMIDSGADISIIGGDLFRRVASAAHLKKRDFKPADKVPRTYDQKPFSLDGRMDLDVTFDGQTMRTPIYVKMDAHDPLLLSEGVCRQLGIISYHPGVEKWRGGSRTAKAPARQSPESQQLKAEAIVPSVRVSLVTSVRLLPHQAAVVPVRMESECPLTGPLLLEPDPDAALQLGDMLLQFSEDGMAQAVVSNPTGCSCFADEGTVVGEVTDISVVASDGVPELGPIAEQEDVSSPQPEVRRIGEASADWRRQKLLEMVGSPEALSDSQVQELHELLGGHHNAFCLEELERGETDILGMDIATGEARPVKQPARRMPFAVRQEVARQLHEMQRAGVIQPSSSPWASPVVMVRKRDGSHRFCVDYRQLNAVTKADTFPLPRIDDLLDQLGASRYFSSIDLASGYWQIRMHAESVEKTAFVTPHGLYEFRVMPFGLTNAPAVFQRLMERVLAGLNPEEGPNFVVVYIDDVLIFSRSLEEHFQHLRMVLRRIEEAGLKLKPSKCQFLRREVEYLGHLITPEGLQTNPRLVTAVKEFARPRNLQQLRRFVGLSSYYRRFIQGFSQIAQPLHALTRKGAEFRWTEECEQAMITLKARLISAPVLAYPSFDRPFVLETDASIVGLGAVLSQPQDDGQLHPVAYASRSLSAAERNYAITELETLAVVWAINHFHFYLYGHSVKVLTDHTAVKAILETPNPSGRSCEPVQCQVGAPPSQENV